MLLSDQNLRNSSSEGSLLWYIYYWGGEKIFWQNHRGDPYLILGQITFFSIFLKFFIFCWKFFIPRRVFAEIWTWNEKFVRKMHKTSANGGKMFPFAKMIPNSPFWSVTCKFGFVYRLYRWFWSLHSRSLRKFSFTGQKMWSNVLVHSVIPWSIGSFLARLIIKFPLIFNLDT